MMDLNEVSDLIKRHEGLRLSVYKDTNGFRTIGWGFNLDQPGAEKICQLCDLDYGEMLKGFAITKDQAQELFQYSLHSAISDAEKIFADFDALCDRAQMALTDMAFNLGYSSLSKFNDLKKAIAIPDYNAAAAAMTTSKWFIEVKLRGRDDVLLMRSCMDG